jgi:hypothetical protein
MDRPDRGAKEAAEFERARGVPDHEGRGGAGGRGFGWFRGGADRSDGSNGHQFETARGSFATGVAKPTEEDFEDAIVRAMLDGRTEVAEVLARALKAWREAGSRNVLRMPPRLP